MENKVTSQIAGELLVWHKPVVERISVSLDTAADSGSNTDGFSGSIIPG